ncbi:MAG TPA: C40 family peptidase [Bacteroidales bacterium]|nr:C40 family peptidase [Bacteroidales bacterium]
MKLLPIKDLLKLAAILFLLPGCASHSGYTNYTSEVDSLVKTLIPDHREGICSIAVYQSGCKTVVSGETSESEIKSRIAEYLKSRKISYTDSLRLIPDTTKSDKPWGIINVSVCNIRMHPGHEMELVSQALLGTPVRILSPGEDWYRIQTPDSYIGWVDADAVVLLSRAEFMKWKSSQRIIFLSRFGDVIASPGDRAEVSDIVAGSIAESDGQEKGYFRVILPDGRKGFLPEKDCANLQEWAKNARAEPGSLIKTALELLGTPYLWGGTSVRGLDCSGFVKTVYYLNGTILARDASLQVRHGLEIKNYKNLGELEKGDLLFFGPKGKIPVRPTHVGMYIGNAEYINESGMVKINSLDSARKNFSRYRYNSFIAARRITGAGNDRGIRKLSDHNWYF